MAIFVLVHGGWSGADIWRHVRRRLQGAGHEVFTPSLTGLGERVHLASPQVTLSTHVSDVANLVLYEDLSDVVLVGFSYGGFVVTGALCLIGERVRHLIYLDAFVPQDGDTVLGLAGRAAPKVGLGAPWLVPPPPRVYDDPVEAAFAADRRAPHPLGCLT
jgi:pimeloyl-ACP methyl ester carboxylesterase